MTAERTPRLYTDRTPVIVWCKVLPLSFDASNVRRACPARVVNGKQFPTKTEMMSAVFCYLKIVVFQIF